MSLFTMGSGGGGAATKFPEFTYTGDYTLIDDGREGSAQNWRVKFLTSGTLTFTKAPGSIDVFLVGGGAGGERHGGGGGYTKTIKKVPVEKDAAYEIVVGAGGPGAAELGAQNFAAGGTTSAFGYTALGGAEMTIWGGNDGGSGGGGYGNNGAAGNGGSDGSDGTHGPNDTGYGKGQGTTTREFGEPDGDLYSGGGAGGVLIGYSFAHGTGGEGGGGNSGVAGEVNTGGGGGGVVSSANWGANGGSGVVVIRNHREVSA